MINKVRFNKFGLSSLFAALVLCTFASESSFAAEKGEKSLGVVGGYTTGNHSAVAGLYFQYAFSSKFRLAPDMLYTFRNEGVDAYSINLNAHVPFSFSENKLELYPLAGINYTSWNLNGKTVSSDNDDAKTRVDRIGLNLGGGIGYKIKPTLRIAVEAKYNMLKDYNAGLFSVSLGYIF